MSKSSMASSSSFSCSPLSHDYERPDLESIKALVLAINEYFLEFLGNADLWNSLKSQCISKLNIRNQEFFEFSEHSVLSNLYWGIENIEAAIQANCTGEKTTRLMNSERMLQAPALLDEHGVTAGIQNHYLVCCSYFYLSAVRKLQNDEWQVALHFLQAILVSPRLVRTQLAPELCETLFPSSTVLEMGIMGRKNDNESVTDFLNEANINDAVREITRRYKHWLMYYQIMLYGATPQWNCISRSTSSYNGESQHFWQVTNSSNSSNSIEEDTSCKNTRTPQASCLKLDQICTMMVFPHASQQKVQEVDPVNISSFLDCNVEDNSAQRPQWRHKAQVTDQEATTALKNCRLMQRDDHSQNSLNEFCLHSGKDSNIELMTIFEKAISRLCFSEGLAKCEEEYAVESAIEDIKKKGLRLCDLATALKQNVHEAAILIYLIEPSPVEIKTLEILPELMEIVCTSNRYKGKPASELLTPPAASLMIIEILVTAFDCATNNMHLAAINSPRILSRILDVARENNLEECISMANILIKCMQFDGQCRKHISQITPMAPFKHLLKSNVKRAKFTALQFFHEILCMPRSSAISLLLRIRKEGIDEIMHLLLQCVQQLQPDYQLLAANLFLQLDALEHSSGKSMFMEEAMQIILKSVGSEENSTLQQLSTFILANIGGTYSWTGEPYTVALLVKKAGVTSVYHRNMIRNFDWSDESLQDAGIDSWCSKIAKGIISTGRPVFQALDTGIRSKIRKVSRNSLTAIAWIGCEISKYPNSLRNSACEILLNGIEQFLHPGAAFEERLLACLCIYNYTSGKGMQKLIHFSEGVRESLRRFSSVTWVAEELHRVADFYLPNNSRISCVHTQILEAKHNSSGSVTALIYYMGLLFSGYSDGSIKVWDIKQQSATLVWDLKEHKKAVTCFSLFEPGESLLSGSSDKTIRVFAKHRLHSTIDLPMQPCRKCKSSIFKPCLDPAGLANGP
ncbi:hypothetical protein GH714_029191 [Hevea brasiliensis]|uniref:Uncharacterized protein n=1 Tax=Hevea brasiliensis TaxID=3981 RepID=A0A6A6KJP5_HEVBR|nr:hypothetical protein GH714_029191 [Hevea brasiliensis]